MASENALNYPVVKAVMQEQQMKADGDRASQVRVRLEEVPPSQQISRGQFSREEVHALLRGSLSLESFDEIYKEGQQDFAFALDPSQPFTRPLTEEEDVEWRALWEALLRMDRMSWGPSRGELGLFLCLYSNFPSFAYISRFPFILQFSLRDRFLILNPIFYCDAIQTMNPSNRAVWR
jgi:hypothetical protein